MMFNSRPREAAGRGRLRGQRTFSSAPRPQPARDERAAVAGGSRERKKGTGATPQAARVRARAAGVPHAGAAVAAEGGAVVGFGSHHGAQTSALRARVRSDLGLGCLA